MTFTIKEEEDRILVRAKEIHRERDKREHIVVLEQAHGPVRLRIDRYQGDCWHPEVNFNITPRRAAEIVEKYYDTTD